jgi:hypothetical protein
MSRSGAWFDALKIAKACQAVMDDCTNKCLSMKETFIGKMMSRTPTFFGLRNLPMTREEAEKAWTSGEYVWMTPAYVAERKSGLSEHWFGKVSDLRDLALAAAQTGDGKVWVTTSDFHNIVKEYNSQDG